MVKVSGYSKKLLSGCKSSSGRKHRDSISGMANLLDSELMETSSYTSGHSSASDDSEVSNFYANLYTADTFDLDMAHKSLSPTNITLELKHPNRIDEEEEVARDIAQSSTTMHQESVTTPRSNGQLREFLTPKKINRDISSILSINSDEEDMYMDADFHSISDGESLSFTNEQGFYMDRAAIERELDSICSEHMDLSIGVHEDNEYVIPSRNEDNITTDELGQYLQSQVPKTMVDSRDEESSVRVVSVYKEDSREPFPTPSETVPSVDRVKTHPAHVRTPSDSTVNKVSQNANIAKLPSEGRKDTKVPFKIDTNSGIGNEDLQLCPVATESPIRKMTLLNQRIASMKPRRKMNAQEQPLLKESPYTRTQRNYRFTSRKRSIPEQLKKVLSPFQMKHRVERHMQYQVCSDVPPSHIEKDAMIFTRTYQSPTSFEVHSSSPSNGEFQAQIDPAQMMMFTPIPSKIYFEHANEAIRHFPPPPPSSPVNSDSRSRQIYSKGAISAISLDVSREIPKVKSDVPIDSILSKKKVSHDVGEGIKRARDTSLRNLNLKQFLEKYETQCFTKGEERLDETLSTSARADPSPRVENNRTSQKHRIINGDSESTRTRVMQNLSHQRIPDEGKRIIGKLVPKRDAGIPRIEGQSVFEKSLNNQTVDDTADAIRYKAYLMRVKNGQKKHENIGEGKEMSGQDEIMKRHPNRHSSLNHPKALPSKMDPIKHCTSRHGGNRRPTIIPSKASPCTSRKERDEDKKTPNMNFSNLRSFRNVPRSSSPLKGHSQGTIHHDDADTYPSPSRKGRNDSHVQGSTPKRMSLTRISNQPDVSSMKKNKTNFLRQFGNNTGVISYNVTPKGRIGGDSHVRRIISSHDGHGEAEPHSTFSRPTTKKSTSAKHENEKRISQGFPHSQRNGGKAVTVVASERGRDEKLRDQNHQPYIKSESERKSTNKGSEETSKVHLSGGHSKRFEASRYLLEREISHHNIKSPLGRSRQVNRDYKSNAGLPIQAQFQKSNQQMVNIRTHTPVERAGEYDTRVTQRSKKVHSRKSTPLMSAAKDEGSKRTMCGAPKEEMQIQRSATSQFLDIIPKGPAICNEVDELPLPEDTPKVLLFWANAKIKARQESM